MLRGCSCLGGDVTKLGMATVLCTCVLGCSQRVVRSSTATDELCLMNPLSVNLYMYSRRMTWGRWVASQHHSELTTEKEEVGDDANLHRLQLKLPVCAVLKPASLLVWFKAWACKSGQWKVQQQIGKWFSVCSSLASWQQQLFLSWHYAFFKVRLCYCWKKK